MRDGFRTALFNSRGVHSFSHGEQELDLSAKYKAQADEVEAKGFHRFAVTLRELATSYVHDAEREQSRNPFDELNV
jgi:hypothetical protein